MLTSKPSSLAATCSRKSITVSAVAIESSDSGLALLESANGSQEQKQSSRARGNGKKERAEQMQKRRHRGTGVETTSEGSRSGARERSGRTRRGKVRGGTSIVRRQSRYSHPSMARRSRRREPFQPGLRGGRYIKVLGLGGGTSNAFTARGGTGFHACLTLFPQQNPWSTWIDSLLCAPEITQS
jgi:hypothetical protein